MINSSRISISLNGSWYILYDPEEKYDFHTIMDSPYKETTYVPSVFNVSKKGAGYVGVVWYFREITIPAHSGLIEFYFEGWYGKAEFYFHNQKIGERLYGYTPYSILVKPPVNNWMQPNTYNLVVKIDNREQEGQTFQTPVFKQWGGIHRNCQINLLPETFIQSVFASSNVNIESIRREPNLKGNKSIGKVKLYLKIRILSTKMIIYSVESINSTIFVEDPYGKKIKINKIAIDDKFQQVHDLTNCTFLRELDNNLHSSFCINLFELNLTTEIEEEFYLWTLSTPILYNLTVKCFKDIFKTKIGIRQVDTDGNGRLLLNGNPILFLGVNRHDEHPEFGAAFNPQLDEHELQIMKQIGITGLRPAHYPTTDFFLDMCDQIGILVMEEIPNYIMMPDMMRDEKVLNRGRSMFKEMILAHYNHPSVIIWSTSNECKTHLPESKAMINKLIEIGRELDPRRLYHFTGFPGIQNIAEINANVVGINVYYGDSTSGQKLGPETLSDVLKNLRSFMEDPEINMKNSTIFITEFGSQAHYGYHDIHPYKAEEGYSVPYTIYTEERQAAVIESFFEQIIDKPYVSGILVWCWRDNRYEPEISASAASATMKYGILDYSGSPKLGFYALEKMIAKLKKHRKIE